MYGMVNQAIKDLVVSKFGNEKWNEACNEVNVPPEDFVFMQYYPDKVTYDLVGALTKILNLTPHQVLFEFGKHWVLYTAKEGYGSMMDLFGQDYKSCLMNLNNLHARMGMTMPHLTPPHFSFSEIDNKTYNLKYESKRAGLCSMVEGLLVGLAEKYGVRAKVELEPLQDESAPKIFRISILE